MRILNTEYPILNPGRARGLGILYCVLSILATSCSLASPLPAVIPPLPSVPVSITVDGQTQSADLPADLTVREAIARAGLTLNDLDRVTPPGYTRLSSGLEIRSSV